VSGFSQQVTFLFVADLDRSSGFYGGALGLELVRDQGDCRIYRAGAGAYLGVCARPDQVGPGGVIVTLVTDDVSGWHRRLVAAGVEVVSEPRHSDRYGIHHAFYRDPDGHLVEVQRFDEPLG
jgi:catechol 2,3-dioxygenase-like lactoylglutathione lyase family enzyme